MTKIKQTMSNLESKLFGAVIAVVPPSSNVDPSTLGVNLTIQSVFAIIVGLVCWFTRFALVLIVAAVVFYGIKFIMSQGNPTKYGDAKKGLTWAIVGIIVILGTYTIIATVANALGANYNQIIPLKCSVY